MVLSVAGPGHPPRLQLCNPDHTILSPAGFDYTAWYDRDAESSSAGHWYAATPAVRRCPTTLALGIRSAAAHDLVRHPRFHPGPGPICEQRSIPAQNVAAL